MDYFDVILLSVFIWAFGPKVTRQQYGYDVMTVCFRPAWGEQDDGWRRDEVPRGPESEPRVTHRPHHCLEVQGRHAVRVLQGRVYQWHGRTRVCYTRLHMVLFLGNPMHVLVLPLQRRLELDT